MLCYRCPTLIRGVSTVLGLKGFYFGIEGFFSKTFALELKLSNRLLDFFSTAIKLNRFKMHFGVQLQIGEQFCCLLFSLFGEDILCAFKIKVIDVDIDLRLVFGRV